MENRNVIVITADSVRADHCGFIDGSIPTTPELDSLARDSVVFENAIAPAPRTPTSVPETLTGVPMPRGTTTSNAAQFDRVRGHISGFKTLPERLSEQGYHTAAVTGNPWTTAFTGFDDIFDVFREVGADRESAFRRASMALFSGTHVGTMALWVDRWWQKEEFFSQWTASYETVRSLVENLPEPFFLWVFLMDTHNPYIVPRRYRTESSTLGMYYSMLRGNSMLRHSGDSALKHSLTPRVERGVKRAYRDAVRSVDGFVRQLLTDTAESAPLVVFHSDHGEAFGEHGTYGHQQSLYEENIHVPLLVHHPTMDGSTRLSRPLSLRVLPEMLETYARGEEKPWDDWTEEYVVSRTEDASTLSVRGESTKYVRTLDDQFVFDLTADPGEVKPISDGIEMGRYQSVADEYLEAIPSLPEGGDRVRDLSKVVTDRLRTFGYLE